MDLEVPFVAGLCMRHDRVIVSHDGRLYSTAPADSGDVFVKLTCRKEYECTYLLLVSATLSRIRHSLLYLLHSLDCIQRMISFANLEFVVLATT